MDYPPNGGFGGRIEDFGIDGSVRRADSSLREKTQMIFCDFIYNIIKRVIL